MPSIQARMAINMVKINKLIYRPNSPVKFQRHMMAATQEMFLSPKEMRFENVKAGDVPAAWLMPQGADKTRVILYLHGGGYVIGAIRGYRKMAGWIAEAAGCKALLVEYRRAPENTFPAPLEDTVSTYRWLLAQGYRPENIVIAGDSAGGGLAVAALVSLRDSGDPLPAAALILSPWADLEMTGDSALTMARKDPMLTVRGLKKWADTYLGDADPKDPLVSPIYADLKSLPPMLIQVGSREILLDDARRLAERARECGVDAELDVLNGMCHISQMLCPLVPESKAAVERLGSYCTDRMTDSSK